MQRTFESGETKPRSWGSAERIRHYMRSCTLARPRLGSTLYLVLFVTSPVLANLLTLNTFGTYLVGPANLVAYATGGYAPK